MSARNTLENKYTRKATRGLSKLAVGTEVAGRIPQNISASILSNPKQMRLSGRSRRRLQRGRGMLVAAPTTEPRSELVKTMVKLSKLTLTQLQRRLKQSARRASTCKHLIANLSPSSMFAIKIKSAQSHELRMLKQISAEIESRQPQSK